MSRYTDAVDAHRTAAEIIDAQMRDRMAAARAEESRGEWGVPDMTPKRSGEAVNSCVHKAPVEPAREWPATDEPGDVEAWRVAWQSSQAELAQARAAGSLAEAVADLRGTQLAEAQAELAAAQAELARREQVWEDRHNTQLAQVKALQEMLAAEAQCRKPSHTEWTVTPTSCCAPGHVLDLPSVKGAIDAAFNDGVEAAAARFDDEGWPWRGMVVRDLKRPASPQPAPINHDLARAKRDEPRPITDAMVDAACIECPFVGPERIRAALEAAERAR